MVTSVIIGRFQPAHRGHVDLLRQATRGASRLIIIVGSPTTVRTATECNPLTTRERLAMLRTVLKDVPIPCKIIIQRDVGVNAIWLSEVRRKIPKDALIISGNPDVLSIFRPYYTIRKVRKQIKVSGTIIRRLARSGNARWKRLVPSKIASDELGRRLSRGAR